MNRHIQGKEKQYQHLKKENAEILHLSYSPSLACGVGVGVGGAVEGDGGEDGDSEVGVGREAVAGRDGEDREDDEGGACDLETKWDICTRTRQFAQITTRQAKLPIHECPLYTHVH